MRRQSEWFCVFLDSDDGSNLPRWKGGLREMSGSTEGLQNSVSVFFESRDRDYEIPAGGHHQLLTAQEQELLAWLSDCGLSIEQKISTLVKDRDWSECYSLVIFGVRLAILAVRQRPPSTYSTGLVALVAGSPKVDWRDVLGAFAIFDACGRRIGVDFQAEVERVAACGEPELLRSTIDGFFSRDAEMRCVDVMGFQECGVGETLNYRPKSML